MTDMWRLWCFGVTYCVRLQSDRTGSSDCWSDVIASGGRDCFVLGEGLPLFFFFFSFVRGGDERRKHDLLGALLALQVGHCLGCFINQSVRLDLPVWSCAADDCRLCLRRHCSGKVCGLRLDHLVVTCGTLGTVRSRKSRSCCNGSAPSSAITNCVAETLGCRQAASQLSCAIWRPYETAGWREEMLAVCNCCSEQILVFETVTDGCFVWSESWALQHPFREFWFN